MHTSVIANCGTCTGGEPPRTEAGCPPHPTTRGHVDSLPLHTQHVLALRQTSNMLRFLTDDNPEWKAYLRTEDLPKRGIRPMTRMWFRAGGVWDDPVGHPLPFVIFNVATSASGDTAHATMMGLMDKLLSMALTTMGPKERECMLISGRDMPRSRGLQPWTKTWFGRKKSTKLANKAVKTVGAVE